MKNISFVFTFLFLFTNYIFSQKPAYVIYHNGDKVEWQDLLKATDSCDVIFFGELHDNPIAHWLEYELVKDLYQKYSNNLILGAEMFETDNQLILNEYLNNLINEKNFIDEAKLWQNYQTDYRPLVEFAKKNNLQFIATNIPRRYAAAVNYGSFAALNKFSKDALTFIAPLPIPFDSTLDCYASLRQMPAMGKAHTSKLYLDQAQAIKDATMAWNIMKNLAYNKKFIHFNGAYHSDYHQSIIWYLNYYLKENNNNNYKILTITVQEVDNLESSQVDNAADFIILTPSSLTKTY